MTTLNGIQHKRSSVTGKIPNVADIKTGELALNLSDRIIYTKDGSNNIIQIANGPLKYANEIHVSPSGNDTTGTGAYEKPYATITAAYTAATNSGDAIFIHPGTYSDSITFTKLNVDVIGLTGGGGIVNLTGTWTINHASSSNRFYGLTFASAGTLSITAAGGIYLIECNISGTVTANHTGYLEFRNCVAQATSITLQGLGQCAFWAGKQSNMTVSAANKVVSVHGSMNCSNVTVTAGTFSIADSFLFSASGNTTAATMSSGAIFYAYNTHVYNTAGTLARLGLPTGSFYSLNSVQYDRANTTISGTSLGTETNFDSARLGSLTVVGQSALGAVANVRITGGSNGQVLTTNGNGGLSWTTTASSYGDSNVANYLPTHTGNISGNVISASSISISGTANLGAIGNITITGGSNGQMLSTDGNGTLRWANGGSGTGTSLINGNSSVVVNSNANVTFTIAGNANLVTMTTTQVLANTMDVVSNIIAASHQGNSLIVVQNAGNVTINKGQPVYVSGSAGGSSLQVKLANSALSDVVKVIGVAQQTLAANGYGYVVTEGLIANVDTSAFANGDMLYVSNVAGTYTTGATSNPVRVGWVQRANATTGSIYVGVDAKYTSIPELRLSYTPTTDSLTGGNLYFGNTTDISTYAIFKIFADGILISNADYTLSNSTTALFTTTQPIFANETWTLFCS